MHTNNHINCPNCVLKIKVNEQLYNKLSAQLGEKYQHQIDKTEQGSMQVPGELQQLAVAQWLRGQYPQDPQDPQVKSPKLKRHTRR